MIEHARFGQRSSLCLCGRHGASLFATATSLLLLLGSVATAAAAEASSAITLPGTSWTATGVQGQNLPADVIPLLRFREPYDYSTSIYWSDHLPDGTMNLEAVFSPCFSLTLLYEVKTSTAEGEMKTLLQITDKPSDCTACMSASEIAACRNPSYKPDDQSKKDTLMDASQSFFDALMQAKSFTITTGVLELRDAFGVTVMQLISCETESELAGTDWHPYMIYPTDAPAISLTQEQQQRMSAEFRGCSVRGSLGCNGFGSDYKTNVTTDPSEILLDGIHSTEVGCDIWSLESEYSAALGKATAYKLSANATHQLLDLTDAKTGDTLLSFVPRPTRSEGLSENSSTRVGTVGGGLVGFGFSWIVAASLCMSNGPSIVTTATYLLLLSLLGSVKITAAAEMSPADQLIGTSWTARAVQGQGLPVDVIPLPAK